MTSLETAYTKPVQPTCFAGSPQARRSISACNGNVSEYSESAHCVTICSSAGSNLQPSRVQRLCLKSEASLSIVAVHRNGIPLISGIPLQ